MRSSTFPCPIANMYVVFYDANKNYIRYNHKDQGVTAANTWQECSFIFRPAENEYYVNIRVALMDQPKDHSAGVIWCDNFYLGEGIGFE